MKNIKVIMCDIDGTLLNSKGIVTSKTIDAIKKVREQGILFGISTGRDVPSVKRLFGKWGIGGLVDMVVGSNGGEIYDYKTDYYEENFALPGNLIANIMEHYKDMDVNFAIHGDGVLYTPKEDELIKILSKSDQLPYEVIDFDEYLKEDRLKLLIVCKPETMPAVIERAKTFKNERFKCASLQTTQHLFEFMDPRISKSFGLQKLMEMHGFTMENLCTFGDADNDYDMTLHAGVGVVMANGSEKTKSVAAVLPAAKESCDKNNVQNIAIGDTVVHKAFGTGTVIGTETGKITVSFNGAEKKFQFPGAFMQGFLKKQK